MTMNDRTKKSLSHFENFIKEVSSQHKDQEEIMKLYRAFVYILELHEQNPTQINKWISRQMESLAKVPSGVFTSPQNKNTVEYTKENINYSSTPRREEKPYAQAPPVEPKVYSAVSPRKEVAPSTYSAYDPVFSNLATYDDFPPFHGSARSQKLFSSVICVRTFSADKKSFYRAVSYCYMENLLLTRNILELNDLYFSLKKGEIQMRTYQKGGKKYELDHILQENFCRHLQSFITTLKESDRQKAVSMMNDLFNEDSAFPEALISLIKQVLLLGISKQNESSANKNEMIRKVVEMSDEPDEELIKLVPDLFSFNIKIYKPKNNEQFYVTRYICHIDDKADSQSSANSSGNTYPTINLGYFMDQYYVIYKEEKCVLDKAGMLKPIMIKHISKLVNAKAKIIEKRKNTLPLQATSKLDNMVNELNRSIQYTSEQILGKMSVSSSNTSKFSDQNSTPDRASNRGQSLYMSAYFGSSPYNNGGRNSLDDSMKKNKKNDNRIDYLQEKKMQSMLEKYKMSIMKCTICRKDFISYKKGVLSGATMCSNCNK